MWNCTKAKTDGRDIKVMKSKVLWPLLQGKGGDWKDKKTLIGTENTGSRVGIQTKGKNRMNSDCTQQA